MNLKFEYNGTLKTHFKDYLKLFYSCLHPKKKERKIDKHVKIYKFLPLKVIINNSEAKDANFSSHF